MNALIDAALGRTRTVLSIMVIMVLAGVASYISIPKEADPDIPIPFVYVSIVHPGISPEDAERLLIKPMETQLRSIEGLEELQAIASTGHAGLILEFDVNFDKDQALTDVREKVDTAKADLPQDTEEPQVLEFNASLFPVLMVTLSGDVPERTLYQLARGLKDEIETVPTVLEASLVGHREELLEVIIDPARLESYNVSQQELITAVNQNNQLVAAGALDTGQGRFSVKVPGLFETREDVLSLPIKVSGEGVVTLGDIADIRRTFKDPTGHARFNGEPAIAIEVTKRIGENIVDTVQRVRAVVDANAAAWPEGVTVDYTLDQSTWIFRSLASLQASIITAIALVMIIVVAALGLRSALLVGVAIPTSFMIAFLLLAFMGYTVNMMVMFGMVISVGILVDGAIVVVEYADRKMAEGLNRIDAYTLAAKRMFWPIVSSTATTLAAFLPMLLWPGVAGKFMSYLPITLIIVLTASLLTALIFLPVLGSLFGKSETGNAAVLSKLAAAEKSDVNEIPGFTGAYARLLERWIQKPGRIIAGALLLLTGIIVLFSSMERGVEFFIDTEPEQAIVLVSARGNLSAEEMRDLVLDTETIVRNVDGVRTVFTQTGTNLTGPRQGGDIPADLVGKMTIELEPFEERRPGAQILEEIRQKTRDLPGIRVEVRKMEQGPPTGKDIQIQLTSNNPVVLEAETGRVRNFIDNNVTGLIDVEDSRPLPGIEWVLTVDREQAGRFGADVSTVGAAVQLVTNGIKIGEYRPDDAEDELDIRARFPVEYRNTDQLDELRVRTRDGLVPISNFVARKPMPRVDTIRRIDGKRVFTVKANTVEGVLPDTKVREIRSWIETDANIDPRVTVVFRGADENQKESSAFLVNAMFGALFLMAIILITQFNSFYHSALILSSVILSTVGVLIGLMVTGQNFSIVMTGTGIVALAGIVVNNNIVLIDTFQRFRQDGMDTMTAIVRTSAQRLRPVLLTTITTICGLLPMVIQLNVDFFGRDVSIGGIISMWWVQLSTAIVFGLAFSTVLTLLLTPCLLAVPVKLRGYIARKRGRPAPEASGHATPAE